MYGPKDKDNKWVKDQWYKMPHHGKFRKAIIKFVMMLRPNSRSTHHLKIYFETEEISKQAASQVFKDWSDVLHASLTGVAAVIWGGIYAATSINGVTILLIPLIKSILQVAQALIMTDLLPGGVEAQRHLTKRYNKNAEFLEKRTRENAKTKKELELVNKRIKKIKEGPRTIKTRTIVKSASGNFKKSLKMKQKSMKNKSK